MGRPPRIVVAGETYHVFSRGSNRLPIVFDDSDYEELLAQLGRVVQKYHWQLYAYCLIPNHYHLLVCVPKGGLSEGMCELNGGFSRRTSKRYGRIAHLFRNRFGDTWSKDEEQFLHTARYVVLNPVEAGICQHPKQWRWSSYRATVGLAPAPAWLDVAALLAHFDASDLNDARSAYVRFVETTLQTVPGTVTGM